MRQEEEAQLTTPNEYHKYTSNEAAAETGPIVLKGILLLTNLVLHEKRISVHGQCIARIRMVNRERDKERKEKEREMIQLGRKGTLLARTHDLRIIIKRKEKTF